MKEADNPMVTGILLKVVTRLIKAHVFLIALFHFKSWNKTISTLRLLKEKVKQYMGPGTIQKIAWRNGHFYWDMYGVGWPSSHFVRNVKRECNRIHEAPEEHVGMRNVLFGITTKCPLKCEHCYEWDNLNLKERLSFPELQAIIEKLISYGIGQIHFGGGEPMIRYDEILQLLKLYSRQAGFWIVTSGFQLTEDRAFQLREAGLTGVCVSLDHHEEDQHDSFRHYKQSFAMAQRAAVAANRAGLVTALSLCATREYTGVENIASYIDMGRRLGVSFIQLLEPRAVGHYKGKDVKLSGEQKKILEDAFLRTNASRTNRRDPLIIYHEYYKPAMGCRGAGKGALYIDPLGEVHACPFCRNSVGNILTNRLEDCVDHLLKNGCPFPPPEPARRSMDAQKPDSSHLTSKQTEVPALSELGQVYRRHFTISKIFSL